MHLLNYYKYMEVTQILRDFAWYTLNDHQQSRIKLKFELEIMLDERLENETKISIYKTLAAKYNKELNISFKTVRNIAYKLNK